MSDKAPPLTEIIVPSNTRIGQIVVFMDKKYKIIKMLGNVHVNQHLSYALGEYVCEYGDAE